MKYLVHDRAFYQLFVRLSSATSFEPIFGNIDMQLGIYQLGSGEKWRKLELFNFKVEIFTTKVPKI